MTQPSTNFWQHKSLNEMSSEEWESLCDGCGKCCLHKLEDEEDGEVYYTRVSCRYLDESCRCREFQQRAKLVPDCVTLQPDTVADFPWLPSSCAYRLIAEGKPLHSWHPLISGDSNSVHKAGMSIKGRAVSEEFVHPDDIQEHIIHWVE